MNAYEQMREAIVEISNLADAILGGDNDANAIAILDKCKDALALPLRQCDVGTASEQRERYLAHCRRTPYCTGCEAATNHLVGCEFTWAQMTYETQEGAGK